MGFLVGGDWNHGILWLSIQLGMSSSQLLKSMIFQRARSTTKQILLQSTCSAKQLTSSRPKWTIYGRFTVKIAISNGDFS